MAAASAPKLVLSAIATLLTVSVMALLPLSASAAAPAIETDIATRFADLYAAAQKEGQVAYYNEGREEENAALAAFWKKTFPKVRLLITAKQTMALIPTIETERATGRGRADVVTITEPYIASQWKAKGYYASYKTKQFGKIKEFVDADATRYVNGIYLLMPAYNTKAFPDKTVLPKSFADFQDPKWKGKIVLADPKTAGSNVIYFHSQLELKRIEWQAIQKLAPQDILFVRGNAEATNLLSAGERVISPMVSTQNILNAKLKGQPVDFFPNKEGSIELRRTTGIFANAPSPNAARLLLEVVGDPEVQTLLANAGSYWPTNPDAKLPAGMPKLSSMNPVQVDIADDETETAAFVKKFNAVFGR
jgi:iron(III) transport system substrate-binding protein